MLSNSDSDHGAKIRRRICGAGGKSVTHDVAHRGGSHLSKQLQVEGGNPKTKLGGAVMVYR